MYLDWRENWAGPHASPHGFSAQASKALFLPVSETPHQGSQVWPEPELHPHLCPHMALGLVHLCRTPTHLGVVAPQCWGVAGGKRGWSGRRSSAELGTSSYLDYCTSQALLISSQSLLLQFTLCLMMRVTFVKCKS